MLFKVLLVAPGIAVPLINHCIVLLGNTGVIVAVKFVVKLGNKLVYGAAAILIVGTVFIVTVTLAHAVVLHVPSALTKYVVVVFTGTVILAPVPIAVPPQLPVYHLHVAPVPNAPPCTVKVVVVGPQFDVTVLVAPVGATELPFTVIVKVMAVPTHPDALFGVTVMVAVTAVGLLFTATKLGMLPVPEAARPMLGVLFVQLYVVPATVPVKLMAVVDEPVHNTWLAITPTFAVGFTVIVKLADVPLQPDADVVTVMVAVTGALVVLVAVKLGILPVPLAAKPMLGVLFVQVNTVPATGLVNVTAVVAAPLHNT